MPRLPQWRIRRGRFHLIYPPIFHVGKNVTPDTWLELKVDHFSHPSRTFINVADIGQHTHTHASWT